MAYNDELASRIRVALAHQDNVTERKMFGGLSFMVGGSMCCGVLQDNLVLRVSAQDYEEALAHSHARPMDFTNRPMKSFLYVSSEEYQQEEDLQRWVTKALAYVKSLPPKSASRKSGRRAPRQTSLNPKKNS